MGGPRSKASREDILAFFQTEEPFKAVATRIGMSPNTLRGIWKEAFGEEAFKERGRRLQAQAASEVAKRVNQNKIYSDVTVTCSNCKAPQVFKANQVAQMDVAMFICEACRCDRECPVCGLLVDGERGLSGHFRHRREAEDEAHLVYEQRAKDTQWEDFTRDEDYVACLECNYRAFTLARHLGAVHGLTADQYRVKHPEALIRPRKLTEARSGAIKVGWGKDAFVGTKRVLCPFCEVVREVPKQVGSLHDQRCESCRKKADESRWVGLSEPQDYVTCLECRYRAENLTSHTQNAHPGYRVRHPDAYMVAIGSAVRDKSAVRGVLRSPEFGQKIREAKLLNLTRKDFQPFLEACGSVDHRAAMVSIGCAWPALKKYMEALGLVPTRKYIEQAAKERQVILTVEQLEPFKLGNGKISPVAAIRGLGLSFPTIKKECVRLGLPSFNRRISQTLCLDAIADTFGGLRYEAEWKSWRFVNPPTGHRFRFDGYFPDIGLVVEFNGHQHYTFPNAYMTHESYRPVWEKMLERDRIKREMVLSASDLIYLEILEDEPYMDVNYLRGRLVGLGVLEIRPGGIWLGDKLVHQVL